MSDATPARTTASRAHMLADQGGPNAIERADLFCHEARLRIDEHFRRRCGPNDMARYTVASEGDG